MTENILWKGKGPILYEISISQDSNPDPKFLEDHWKYTISVSPIEGDGEYWQLGNDTEDIICLADTKEGIIRDLATILDDQIQDRTERENASLPPEPIKLSNVIITDTTSNGDFKNIDIAEIFRNAHKLGAYISDIPKGEKKYVVVISPTEMGDDNSESYEMHVSTPNFIVVEELFNPSQYELGSYEYEVPKNEVIKMAKDMLKGEARGMPEPPSLTNTKLVNTSNNHEFTLAKILDMAPLKLLQKNDSVMQLAKRQEEHVMPLEELIPEEAAPDKNKNKERLRS